MTRAVLPSMLVLAVGCATARPPVVSGSRFDSLLTRDLPAFEQRIALDSRVRPSDDWLLVARGWADLVSCRPIADAAPSDPAARLVWSTLRLEQARHERMMAEGTDLDGTWLAHLEEPEFFRREAPPHDGRGVRWLPEREVWIDELPALRSVPSDCAERRAVLARDELGALLAREHAAATRARVEAELFDGPSLAALRFRVSRHEAALALRRAALLDEAAGAETNEPRSAAQLRAEAAGQLAALLDAPAPAGIAPVEIAEARLFAAQLADEAGDAERALAIVRPALTLEVDDELRFTLRYRAISLARRTGDLELAAPLTASLPPRTHPLYDATAFEAVRVLSELGRVDELLRVSTSALRDRTVGDDPFRRATLTVVLGELAGTELDARVVELVEDLGPREATLDRMAELTVLALDRGEASVADAAARWLHAHDHDARSRQQYAAWIALAALLRDDEATFDAAIARIVARPEAVRSAVGRRREAAFFREHDRALALLLGEALPRIADWGDAPAARARAQRWLGRIVEHIQGFLRATPGSLEREPLLALYRIASAMLRDAPRGYPEHVARADAPPLVLGQVHLPWPEPPPPVLAPRLTPPHAFALLPRDERPEAWLLAWPTDAATEGQAR